MRSSLAVLLGFELLMLAVAQLGTNCTNTLDCDPGYCCRSGAGAILYADRYGPWRDPSTTVIGVCTNIPPQLGDPCDNICRCSTGLTCYRPVEFVDVGEATLRCGEAVAVEQIRQQILSCWERPNCYQ